MAYFVNKGNLHFIHDLKDCLLGKYLVISPRKSKLKIQNYKKFCLSKKEVFRKLPVRKTEQVLAKSLFGSNGSLPLPWGPQHSSARTCLKKIY